MDVQHLNRPATRLSRGMRVCSVEGKMVQGEMVQGKMVQGKMRDTLAGGGQELHIWACGGPIFS
jgi:hypothetical protein